MSRIDDRRGALVEMNNVFHQASFCEFQRELKFETEDKMWQQKYTRRFVSI